MFSLLGHSREEEDSGMEGGLVVGYMQINSLGGRGGTAGRTGMCGAVDITVCAQRRPSFRISSSILSMPICASLCLSHSITRFSLLLLLLSHSRSESEFGLARSVSAPHASITS